MKDPKYGQKVIVTKGDFMGCIGKICHIKGGLYYIEGIAMMLFFDHELEPYYSWWDKLLGRDKRD